MGTPPRDRRPRGAARPTAEYELSLEDAANTSLEDARVYCHGAMTIDVRPAAPRASAPRETASGSVRGRNSHGMCPL